MAKIKVDQGFITEAVLGFEMAIISIKSLDVLSDSCIAMENLMNNNYKVLEEYKGVYCLKSLANMAPSKIVLQENYKSKLISTITYKDNVVVYIK